MAPLRRYLRITKYSAIECRIYVEHPSLVHSWLLHPLHPVLPEIMEAIRPLVLPKIREEQERSRYVSGGGGVLGPVSTTKGGKKKAIRDVVKRDGFEVTMFLTETPTRHSILIRQRHFTAPKARMTSTSKKLLGDSVAAGDVESHEGSPPILQEDDEPTSLPVELVEDEGGGVSSSQPKLYDIPAFPGPQRRKRARSVGVDEEALASTGPLGGLRPRTRSRQIREGETSPDREGESDEVSNQEPEVREDDSSDHSDAQDDNASDHDIRRKSGDQDDENEKKKMAAKVKYEGFAIYGRVLCLIVNRVEAKDALSALQSGRRRGRAGGAAGSGTSRAKNNGASTPTSTAAQQPKPTGLARMENWISATQAQDEDE